MSIETAATIKIHGTVPYLCLFSNTKDANHEFAQTIKNIKEHRVDEPTGEWTKQTNIQTNNQASKQTN